MTSGGSTKPWIVKLQGNDGSVDQYVVKLFSPQNIEQQHAVAKEVYGSILAREFSLPTPDFALVDFDSDFIDSALQDEQRATLKRKAPGYKFASRLADSMSIVSPQLYKKYLKEYDISNVYAFDLLICNLDRGGLREKPNLLVDDENFLLIDHEQVFPFADNEIGFYENILAKFNNDELSIPYQRHLFFPLLKSLQSKRKTHLFDEFEEYLRRINLTDFVLAINELEDLQISVGHYERIIEYLRRLSQDAHKFCNILLSSIS